VALTAAVSLITGNTSHFPVHYRSQMSILTPTEFIAAIL
jgi:hypothetical protein